MCRPSALEAVRMRLGCDCFIWSSVRLRRTTLLRQRPSFSVVCTLAAALVIGHAGGDVNGGNCERGTARAHARRAAALLALVRNNHQDIRRRCLAQTPPTAGRCGARRELAARCTGAHYPGVALLEREEWQPEHPRNNFGSREAIIMLHALAKSGMHAGEMKTAAEPLVVALERRVLATMPAWNGQDIGKLLCAFATMQLLPSPQLLADVQIQASAVRQNDSLRQRHFALGRQ